VIPVYKTYDFIERLIKSIESQSLKCPVELIFIDDTPIAERKSLKVLIGSLNTEIPTFCYVNSKNMGVTYSRNKGYFKSNGQYVFFLDSDDTLLDSAMNIITSKLNAFDCSIYLFRVVGPTGKVNGIVVDIEKTYLGVTCVTDAYGIGECFVGVKKYDSIKPFISTYRGHELAGLSRFISKIDNKSLYLGNDAVRMYFQDNAHSLSKGTIFTSRLKDIAKGHLYLSSLFFKESSYLAAITWLSKYIIRNIQSKMVNKS